MASVSSGDVVADKYRVERMLGSGGMGYVVAARHLTLDQLVAIKFLAKDALGDEEAYARFRREAKAAVRLKSDNVAKVFDVGVHDRPGDEGSPFIVMEYLEGADLGAVAKERGALPAAEACEYILQACQALAEAHALGIVHRDVKLANLFLTTASSGWPLVKVLDFGVSKTIAAGELNGDVTRTAAMLGSPKYMSPEQMNDPREVDARTDVWSLGICLYRLVAGRAPFDGDTIGRLCTMVLHEMPPPITVLRPDLPSSFELLVNACLQKDRNLRFSNVAELAASLVPFCVEPERAREMAAHVASLLGVQPPPIGYLPPSAVLAQMQGSGSVDGAWAHTFAAQQQQQQSQKRRYDLTVALVLGAMALVIGLVSAVVFGRSPSAPTAAAAAPPPLPARSPPSPATPATDEAPKALPVAATTGLTPPSTTADTPPPTTSPRKPSGARGAGRPAGRADPPGDGLPIPSDRK